MAQRLLAEDRIGWWRLVAMHSRGCAAAPKATRESGALQWTACEAVTFSRSGCAAVVVPPRSPGWLWMTMAQIDTRSLTPWHPRATRYAQARAHTHARAFATAGTADTAVGSAECLSIVFERCAGAKKLVSQWSRLTPHIG